MTVRDLMDLLAELPPEAEVYVDDRHGYQRPLAIVHVGWYSKTSNSFITKTDDPEYQPGTPPDSILII